MLRSTAVIDLKLKPPDDNKRERREEEADADLTQRGKRKETTDRRIKPVIEQRNHCEDENSVYDLDLLRQEFETEEIQVELLALNRPFTTAALIPKRPQDHGKDVDHPNAPENAQPFFALQVTQKTQSARRDVHHLFAAEPENNRSEKHQDTW